MQTHIVSPNVPAMKPNQCAGFVLVVDDEEHNRTLLRDPLAARGYEVCEAENGEQALEMIAARIPDVLLLDVMMPEMDGFDLCNRIKTNPETASVPVLMLTALSERHERLKGIKAGANDFLTKPIDLQDVLLRVANAVRGKHLFDRLQAEQQRSENLLLNVLPEPIAARMKKGETNIVDSFPQATVLIADLVGFTTMCAHIKADEVVWLLNEVFTTFDSQAERHGLEKIKTIGDAYMVVGGVPLPRSDHVEAIANLAIDLREAINGFNRDYDTSFQFRMGICSGPVVAGVIGRRKFSYDLWGETVNIASRLGEFSEPGAIQISGSVYERLKGGYTFGRKQHLEMKSGHKIVTHTLCARV